MSLKILIIMKYFKKADKIIENAEHNALPVENVSRLIAKCLVSRDPKHGILYIKTNLRFD